MKAFYYLVIFFAFISCNTVKQYNKSYNEPISKKKIIADIDYTYNKLTKLHPHLYDYIDETAFKFKFDSLKASINQPITKSEFYFKLSPIIASIRQGHTVLRAPNIKLNNKQVAIYNKYGVSPLKNFDLEVFDNKLFIVKNNSNDSTIKVGSEIISVNNIRPQEIDLKYKNTYASDGYNQTLFKKGFVNYFEYYIYREIGLVDSISLTYLFNDTLYNKILKHDIAKTALETKKSNTSKRVNSYSESKRKSNQLTFNDSDSSIAILRVTNFSFEQYKLHFSKIDSIQSDYLILDLRNNPGGSLNYSAKLFSYLIDSTYSYINREEFSSRTSYLSRIQFKTLPVGGKISFIVFSPFVILSNTILFIKIKKEGDRYFYSPPSKASVEPNLKYNFKGKTYVIIDGGTFSAASVLSSNLKQKKLAYFVGEETGGAQNECVAGFIPTFILPNSKLKLNFGLVNIESHGKSDIKGRGIFPDTEILPTIEDRIKGVDPELNWILNDIKNNQNQE